MTVKELKKNNMPTDIESYKIKYSGGVGKTPTEYAPFKMLGHELPGPNQRTPSKALEIDPLNAEMVDKTSKRSGTLYTEGGVGSSPSKFGAWNKLKEFVKSKTQPAQAIPNQDMDPENAPATPESNAARLDALESGTPTSPPTNDAAQAAAEAATEKAAQEELLAGNQMAPVGALPRI